MDSGIKRCSKVVAVRESLTRWAGRLLLESIRRQSNFRANTLQAASTSQKLMVRLTVWELVAIVSFETISKVVKGWRSWPFNWCASLVATWKTVALSRGSLLAAFLSVHWLWLLAEVDLEIGVVIVVPILNTVNAVLHTEEHCLGLEICKVLELDGEVEAIVAIVLLLTSDIVGVFGDDLRCGLPII